MSFIVAALLMFSPYHALADEDEERDAGLPEWAERVRLEGSLEGDFVWTKRSDIEEKNSDNMSDLFLSTVEVGIAVDFTDWIITEVLVSAEDIGTEDETGIEVDEATIALEKDDVPLYLVLGKRAQPFGVFENHLVEGPMTEDAYETETVGITAGYTGPLESEFSVTVYQGDEMMENFFDSELFDSENIERKDIPVDDDVSSFIVAALVTPLAEHITLFGSFVSEPGTDERNDTAGVGFNIAVAGFRLDGEYMRAVNRERYVGLDREFKDGVLSVTAAYELVVREREVIGGALFAERKAHLVSEPFEAAVRYEYFDDDGLSEAFQTWAVQYKYSAGARYAFYHDEESGLAAFIATEYRHTGYRVHPSRRDSVADDNDEVFVRLGVTF
jgi:hypothetical protein